MWRAPASRRYTRPIPARIVDSMAYDTNNVFARILRGEIPAHKVFEDEHTLAFMDVMPQADGHTLVIPKTPAENLFDLPEAALAATILTTQRVARAVRKAFDAPGIMIAQLNGRDGRADRLPHPFSRHAACTAASTCGFMRARWRTTRFSRSTPRACAQRSTEPAPRRGQADGVRRCSKPLYDSAGGVRRAGPVPHGRTTSRHYAESVRDPEAFWGRMGRRLDWVQPYTKVKDVSFDERDFRIRWFHDGKLNVASNCLDRHLATRGDKTAIICEGDDPGDSAAHHLSRAVRARLQARATRCAASACRRAIASRSTCR